MKKTISFACIFLFMIVFASTSFAMIQKLEGRKAVSANANLSWADSGGNDFGTRTLTAGFSYFPKDFLEAKGTLFIMNVETGGTDTKVYSLLAQCNYNFFKPKAILVPYAGVQLGFAGYDSSGTKDDTDIAYGLQGGVKYFVSEDLSMNAELNYMIANIEPDDVKAASLLFGLSYYF